MKNLLFYTATVFIWGSTWIGIKMQLGTVDPMVSVVYRFTLASLLLFFWCKISKLNLRFSRKQHFFMAAQGLLLFGFNYLLFYVAELYVTSGLAAVLFSTIVVMNIVNSALFLKKPIESKLIFAGLMGLTGIVLVFHPEISAFSLDNHGVRGLLLCIAATLLASFGNILSAYNQRSNALPIVQTNAFGMGYGAFALLMAAILTSKPFSFETTLMYTGSLVYLAVFGSVIAFGCYLTLVGNIGAAKAAYVTLLFPIVALVISTIWESYKWTPESAVGIVLILVGNVLMIHRNWQLPKIPKRKRLAALLVKK